MGKHRDLDTRLERARSMTERYHKSREIHTRRLMRLISKNEMDAVAPESKAIERAERLGRKWKKEVKRLERQIRDRRALNARAPALQPRVAPPVLSPKEQKRLDAATRAEAAKVEQKRKRMSAAGLDHWDPRTANAVRHVDVVNMGSALRASISHFSACIKRKADRTNARVLAWSRFDEHCHRVHAGLLPAPRFEKGVDVSKKPGVSDSRLDALAEDALLRAWLGRDMHGLLVEVIYLHRPFRELEATTGTDQEVISAMFKRALDSVAAFWRLSEDNTFGRALNDAFWRAESAAGV